MDIAKQAVQYYCDTTGKDWNTFYTELDTAIEAENPTGELWLIRKLIEEIIKSGTSLEEFRVNRDMIKSVFDNETRRASGEFYTPEVFCSEGRRYFDDFIPNWKEMNVWDTSCGSGNLMRTSNHNPEKLFLSTLFQEDVDAVKATDAYKTANVFALDFLSELDYDDVNTFFLNKLPARLKEIILNNEPLIFYMNPPYKSGIGKDTDVGVYMCETGYSSASGDLAYQFIWRVLSLIKRYKLTNAYMGIFCSVGYFTGMSTSPLLKDMLKHMGLLGGMCFNAAEFSDVSTSMPWGICYSLWQVKDEPSESQITGFSFDKGSKNEFSKVDIAGKIRVPIYTEPIADWEKPRDVVYYKNSPLMTSYATFKDSEPFEMVAKLSGKIASNALATMMTYYNSDRSGMVSGVLSEATTKKYVSITEENFWRCVASVAFRRSREITWETSKSIIKKPDVTVEGYDVWLKNALVYFLFDYKTQVTSLRNVKWEGSLHTVRNHLFMCSEAEVREVCVDEIVLRDLELNPPTNEFILKQIEESRELWIPETAHLFDFCKSATLYSFGKRKELDYKCCTNAWDAGFNQVRHLFFDAELDGTLQKALAGSRDWIRKEADKFNFSVQGDLA